MTFSPGDKIGAYTIVRLLGQGGMGAVYEVEHVELGTHYALKTFVYDAADEYADMLLNKFREEAKMLSRINHPYVSRAFDLTYDREKGVLYYVMDLVLYKDGESYSLGEVDRASLNEDLVYCWFCDACEALDHIHSLGIVHRDVKLENFLLNPDKHAVLSDFGVSRVFGAKMKKDVAPYKTMRIKLQGSTEMTVLGSEHYIAPEVLAGQEATPAADAYGLGIMIFKLFTDEWADKKSLAQVDAFLHGYKYRWYKVVPRLLEFDPEKRPKQLVDLIELLDRDESSVAAEKPKVAAPKKSRKRFDAVRFLLSAFFLLGFVAAASWFGYQGFMSYDAERKNESERTSAELKRQIAEQKEAAQKIEAERKRLAAEAAARQKEEQEKIAAAKHRAEEKQKVEDNRQKIVRNESAPERKVDIPVAKPESPKKDEFVLVDGATDKLAKDYGPIPNKTYTWLKGGNAAFPQEVKFQLSNGETMDLVPVKAATDYQPNAPFYTGKRCHKVTITRPFWMTKYLLTANQWREYAPNDCDDCRPIEKALTGTGYTVSRQLSRTQIDAYCEYLSAKYASQLPKGYIFRLPTEAEWRLSLAMDATVRKYEDEGGWGRCTGHANGSTGIPQMKTLRRERKLDQICEWDDGSGWWAWGGGFSKSHEIFVGGRMKPFASGIYDLDFPHIIFYDKVLPGGDLGFDDVSVDPLKWVADSGAQTVAKRDWQWSKDTLFPMDHTFLTHIVVAPDLVAERAWEHCRKDPPKVIRRDALAMCPSKWQPKVSPRKMSSGSRKSQYYFTLDNGAKMEFCLCPEGSFNMSNVPGQAKLTHRVTLTRPFLISKYNVTAEQWRDFGVYDCEGVPRELEILFKKEKFPICVRRYPVEWEKFCAYMTERYRKILPEGYVFRLPTEAELEWSMVAGPDRNVCNLDGNLYDDADPRFRDELSHLLGKRHFGDVRHFDLNGWYRGCYVGGRTKPNGWGVCDLLQDRMCLDHVESDWREHPENRDEEWHDGGWTASRDLVYCEHEVDPVRWGGRVRGRFVRRWGRTERRMGRDNWDTLAHIVIGPDVFTDLKKKEEADYPVEDFGGHFVGDHAKVSDMSSMEQPQKWNTPERHKLLLSRENVIVREKDKDEDLRACHTKREDAPWVQIELEKPTLLAGIQIDVLRAEHYVRHLRIWASDGGKELRLIASDNREHQRFRFDLNGKNIKAKFIRIGREPGFMNEYFNLNKVLIYGK